MNFKIHVDKGIRGHKDEFGVLLFISNLWMLVLNTTTEYHLPSQNILFDLVEKVKMGYSNPPSKELAYELNAKVGLGLTWLPKALASAQSKLAFHADQDITAQFMP